jgi:hypothetical protein
LNIAISRADESHIRDCVAALAHSELGRVYFPSEENALASLAEGVAQDEVFVAVGARTWTGLIQLRDGSTAVYHWSSDREPGEEWTAFVSRCAEESLAAVDRFPGDIDLPVDLSGLILYNLTWVSQDGYLDLQTRVRRQKSRSWLSRLLLANARRRRPR